MPATVQVDSPIGTGLGRGPDGRVRGPAQVEGPARQLTGRLTEVALGYQRILAMNPQQPDALVGMSLVALASRQHHEAVAMATAAVAAAPQMCAAWVALGQALKADGHTGQAERAYAEAIRRDGTNALARLGLGELRIAGGRAEEAEREFALALERQPGLISAQLGLGNAFALNGRNEEALARYRQALELRPRLPEAEYAAGFVLARMGRAEEAERRFRRALTQRPDFAAAWIGLGVLLREQGRDIWALAALSRAVELRPDLVAGWLNLALLERELQRPNKAEECLRKAFALDPDQVETMVAWCQLRLAEKDMAGAWGWVRWALTRNPDHAEAVNMQGILLHTEERFGEAAVVFAQAEVLGSPAAWSNRGNSLLDLGRMNEALAEHEIAVERDPKHPGARYNLALTRLRLGDWKRGWVDYEARWHFREVHARPRKLAAPRWNGEPLEGDCGGKRVLLHAEQGLGDTIQFCRYATLVAAQGGYPILSVQPQVERLVKSLAVVRAGLAETARLWAEPDGFDLECPLMSLPAVFGTTQETVPWPGAYLGAEPEEIEAKRQQFPSANGELRAGFAWAGNPRYKADRNRSVELKTFMPLLGLRGVAWISLQKNGAEEPLRELPSGLKVFDGSSRDRDLAGTAALVATLDLVITTDTCIAHLAGAMGKPVWILLPYLSDWRWMQNIPTTPWYPTARLLRQNAPGDWPELMERAAGELKNLLRSGLWLFSPPVNPL